MITLSVNELVAVVATLGTLVGATVFALLLPGEEVDDDTESDDVDDTYTRVRDGQIVTDVLARRDGADR